MVVLDSTTASLVQLWRDGVLSDVQIHSADGQAFHCHRIILAAASAYFRAQLAGPWSEATGADVALKVQLHIPSGTMQRVLEGIYTNDLRLPDSDEGLLEVLDAVNYLGIPAQKAACCQVGTAAYLRGHLQGCAAACSLSRVQVLRSQLKPGTAVSILAAADQYDCSELYQQAVRPPHTQSCHCPSSFIMYVSLLLASQHEVVRTHFDVISTSPDFSAEVQQLPLRVLLQLLEHTGLQTASEAPVLEVSFAWSCQVDRDQLICSHGPGAKSAPQHAALAW